MLDDGRFPIKKKEKIIYQPIRFRTLGCYPLTAATLSDAKTIPQIIRENKKFNHRFRNILLRRKDYIERHLRFNFYYHEPN